MKKEAGFTLIEVLAVIVLLGLLLPLIYNVMLQNTVHQKRVKNEIEVQNSAKALLNHIGEVVMEQNVPIVKLVNTDTVIEGTVYEVAEVSRIEFSDDETILIKLGDGDTVKLGETIYNHIDNISVVVKDKSLAVTVKGVSDKSKAIFSSTFYTRNSGGVEEIPTILYGDVNGDGSVNGADALRLSKYVLGQNVIIDERASELNCDGEVNKIDEEILRKYINGYAIELPCPGYISTSE